MYARVIDATGWTWEYVGQCMTLPRLRAMQKRWLNAPPVTESVAAFLGITPSRPVAANEPISNEELVRDMTTDPRKLTWQAKHG